MTTMAARKAARKPSVSPTSRGATQPTPTMRIRRLFNPLATRLGLFLHWAFTPDTDHETVTLRLRVAQQQTTIWALQNRLNDTTRENRLLRAQLEDLQELTQFGHAIEPNQKKRFSAWDGGPLPPGKTYRV